MEQFNEFLFLPISQSAWVLLDNYDKLPGLNLPLENNKKIKKLLTNRKAYFILGQNSMVEVNYVESAGLQKKLTQLERG
jgi:hypothetical protein